jgi:hypothetical protein
MQTAESREFNYGKEGIVMGQKNLKQRTKEFALSVIRLVKALPKVKTADVPGRQLLPGCCLKGNPFERSLKRF